MALKRVSRKGPIGKDILRSLRQAYADANRQAAALVNAYRRNPLALIDLQGEIERGVERARTLAHFAQTTTAERL